MGKGRGENGVGLDKSCFLYFFSFMLKIFTYFAFIFTYFSQRDTHFSF